MERPMKRILPAIPFLAAFLPASAFAHAHLVSSSPAEGGVLAANAKVLTLTYDGLITEASCTAADAQGKAVPALGAAKPEREKVHVPVTGALGPGSYVLTCKVKADRHEVSHSVKFSVAAGP